MTTDLITADPTLVAVPMMDAAEAHSYLEMMRGDLAILDTSLGNFRARALDFAEREGWKALGYANVADALNAELGTQYSKSYLSRLLGAARIERVIELPIGNSVPESQLRPLAQLDTPEQQRQAWQAASATTGGKPTARAVQQAVEAIKPPPAPAPVEPAATRPATCVRCGAERSLTRLLTTYSAGLVPEYPDRVVSLCSVCIPELLKARKAEQPTPAAATPEPDYPRLPPDFAAAQKRARAIGLNLDMDMHGQFSCLNDRNSGVMHYDWPGILAHLGYAERAHAELDAERARRADQATAQPAPLTCTSCGAPITNGHFGGQCGPCYRGEIAAHPAAYPPAGTLLQLPAYPRERAIVLLRALEGLLPTLPTPESLEDLSVAISDLNECREGEEATYWLRVGWALVDMVPDEVTR